MQLPQDRRRKARGAQEAYRYFCEQRFPLRRPFEDHLQRKGKRRGHFSQRAGKFETIPNRSAKLDSVEP